MAIRNPADLRELRRSGRRLMGLDLGTKTIGTALSDTRHVIASPLRTIRRTRFRADATLLRAMIERHDVAGLVIGLPISLDGAEGPRCQSTRQFADNLLALFPIEIAFWDERLSTAAVERQMIAADMRRDRRAAIVDSAAAAYILQGCLDFLANLPSPI
jgi:putative Holliday junction resolvase